VRVGVKVCLLHLEKSRVQQDSAPPCLFLVSCYFTFTVLAAAAAVFRM